MASRLTPEQQEQRAAYRKAYRQRWWLKNRDRILAKRKADRAERGIGWIKGRWVSSPYDIEANVLAH